MPAAETPALPRLLSPLRLAGFELRNRIVSTAHSTGLSGGTRLGDRAIAYYAARARGGAVESARIVAPSVIDTELGSEIPHVLEVDEIGEIVTAFAAAAVRVRDGGLDRVELHGGHGNLIQQFLSPLTNQRRDDYGGSPEHRRRFALEVARAVRAAVGPDFVVGLRLSAEEDHPGGPSLADTRDIAPAVVAAGDLNYVNVISGSDLTAWSQAHHYGPMYISTGHMRRLARGIREVVPVPVICVGRVVDPREAEATLEADDVDLVCMTRALIADRDLPEKARRKRSGAPLG